MSNRRTVSEIQAEIAESHKRNLEMFRDQAERQVDQEDCWLSNNAARASHDELELELELAQKNYLTEGFVVTDLEGNEVEAKTVETAYGKRFLVEGKFFPVYYPTDSARKLANFAKKGYKIASKMIEGEVRMFGSYGQFQACIVPVNNLYK